MAKKKELCKDKRGYFVRNLGWRKTASGRFAQKKFYLGSDETKAKIASLKLEQLWDAVCRRWEAETLLRPQPIPDSDSSTLACCANDWVTGVEPLSIGAAAVVSVGVPEVEYVREGRPSWDEVSLAIAEAIRCGETVARVPVPHPLGQSGLESPSVGHWLNALRRDVPSIHIELRDLERHQEAEAEIHDEGVRLINRGRSLLQQTGGGETLHVALDAYERWVRKHYLNEESKLTQWGETQTRQIAFIRRVLPDCSLREIDAQRVEDLLELIRLRPKKDDGKRASVSWTKNCIKQYRHFIRWLNKSPDFDWKRPADLEIMPVKVPESKEERNDPIRSRQVEVYYEAEMQILWEYASPLQRTFMLLALNCGFGRAEVAALRMDQVYLRQKHPHEKEVRCITSEADSWIFMIRPKSGVYGEWKLWPETVAAVDWWLRQREQLTVPNGVASLLVNNRGKPYDEPTKGNNANNQISNRWDSLTEKIRKDAEHANFRELSFNKLRKTAGDLIRSASDGEIMRVFHCRGKPVTKDQFSDLYSNRPFKKVFEAIDIVGQQLRPLWSSVGEPFPEQRKKGGSNISVGKIRRIQEMRRQGYRVAYIAEKVGVSKQTVSRHSSNGRC